MYSAAEFKHRVIVEQATSERNSVGEPELTWSAFVSRRARITHRGGSQSRSDHQTVAQAETEIVLRLDNTTRSIKESMRATINGGPALDIQNVIADLDTRYVTLTCVEVRTNAR